MLVFIFVYSVRDEEIGFLRDYVSCLRFLRKWWCRVLNFVEFDVIGYVFFYFVILLD